MGHGGTLGLCYYDNMTYWSGGIQCAVYAEDLKLLRGPSETCLQYSVSLMYGTG